MFFWQSLILQQASYSFLVELAYEDCCGLLTPSKLSDTKHDTDSSVFSSGMSLCQHHQSTEFMDIQFNFTYTAGDLATLYCRIKDLGTKVVSSG